MRISDWSSDVCSSDLIVGSGTIANEDTSLGASCFAEKRTVETLEQGKPVTPFMSFGDTVRIEMLDGQGNSIFGAIEQRIERQPVPRSEENTSELQSLMRNSYSDSCLQIIIDKNIETYGDLDTTISKTIYFAAQHQHLPARERMG